MEKLKRLVNSFFVVLLLCFVDASLSAQVSDSLTPDLEKIKNLVERSTVTVEFSDADRASGATGFILEYNSKKYIATNIHVFAGQAFTEADSLWTEGPATLPMGMRDTQKSRINTTFPQFQIFSRDAKLPAFKGRDGSIIATQPCLFMSATRDIALIEVQTDIPALKIQDSRIIATGQDFMAIGNPGAEHTLIRVNGKIEGVGPDRLELKLSLEQLKQGMSGGPVVNPLSGEVIGMISYSVQKSERRDDEVHDSDRGPILIHQYKIVIRNFAFRLDNLSDMQMVAWPSFAVQCGNIRAMNERTRNVWCAGFAPLKKWANGDINPSNLQGLEIPGDSDSSVLMAFNSLLRDLGRVQHRKDAWSRWERYQRELESLLLNDFKDPKLMVTVPYLRRIITEDIAMTRRGVAGKLRKDSGKMNTSSGR